MLARLFGQEVVSSCAPSEIREDAHPALLALESARNLLADYGEEPTLVTETGEGFLVSSDQHVIFMGGDGSVGIQGIPAAEGVGHNQEELNNWFSVHEFPDHETHVLAKQLVYDILQSRSGGATDGVWMDELYKRTGAGKYASLRKYLVPSVTDFATRGPEDRARHPGADAAPSTVPAESTDEDMPRELSVDDFFIVDQFPDYATAQRAAQALEKARESTDTATENAMAKKLYAAMPPDLRKYMHDDFRRMLQAEGVLPPTFTRVVWETEGAEAPTIHVLENDQHRLLLTPVGSDLHGFTEDDLVWLASGEAAREVYGLPADAEYVYVQDDVAREASQALTELGYTPTAHRRLDEIATRAFVLSLVEAGTSLADVLRRLVGETASPEVMLHEQQGIAAMVEGGWLAQDVHTLTLTEAGAAQLADPTVRALLSTHEAFAPALVEVTLTRDDYTAIAGILRDGLHGEGNKKETVREIARKLAGKFAAVNPAFASMQKRFLRAAGLLGAQVQAAGAEDAEDAEEAVAPAAGASTGLPGMEEAITGLFRLAAPTEAMRPYMTAFDEAKQAGNVERARGAFEAIRDLAFEAAGTPGIEATHPDLFEKVRAVTQGVKEGGVAQGGKIDRAAVKTAAMKAARSIHGADANEKTVDSMIDNAIEKQGAEDTEDAIQIVVGMLRGGDEASAKPPAQPPVPEAADPMGDEVYREGADGIVEYKRLSRSERMARLRVRRKAKTGEQRKALKARRIMRKRFKAQFQRAARKYVKKVRRFVAMRKPLTTSAPSPWQPEIAEIEMDVFTVPTAEASHYIDLCTEAGWTPAVETRAEGVDLHAPGEVFDAVDDFLFSEALDGDEGADAAPVTEAAKPVPAAAEPGADPTLAGALAQLEGVLPAESPAWGEVKTVLTFLLGNGMLAEAQALVAGVQQKSLTGFEADLTAGATQAGAFAFGDVTPHKAGVALANLHARLTGQTEGLRQSSVATVLDTGRGYKVSEAAFAEAVEGLTPTTEERGPNLTFHTYAGSAGVVAQKVEMEGRPPVCLLTTLPEGAVEAWEGLLNGKAKALPQPKPPVDDGAEGTPKDVAETVTLAVPSERLTDFLEAATHAGAPSDAEVRVEGAQVFVTLPAPVARRVQTLFADAAIVEPAAVA
jgi:hypothetical protein